MMRLIKLLPLFLTFGVILIIGSCGDEKTTNPQDQSPVIPPQFSMIMDFSDFPDTISGDESNYHILTKRNWGWAASNVAVWNSVLTLTLAIPTAAFVEAFNHQPVKQSDGSWLWQYQVTNQEPIYTAKLFGTTKSDSIEWRMLLSKEGDYIDFEWFTGVSNISGTEGNWTLNKEPNSPVPFLFIEWHYNKQEESAYVKYTKLTPTLPGNQSYIFYSKSNEIPYNRFYQIYSAEENRTVDIKWNYEMKFGRVMDPIHFGTPNWQCWDEKLEDTNCPE
jgi:hypothetical protein